MSAIQKSLTTARKADGRTRRLQDEKKKRKKQWELWVTQQKQNYTKQKKQFEADLQRLDAELAQTAESGANAAVRIREIVLGGVTAIPRQEAAPEQEDLEWERMIADDMIVETPGFYHAAMQAAQAVPPPLPPTGPGATSGEELRSTPAFPAPPTYSQASPAPLVRDPYMVSSPAMTGPPPGFPPAASPGPPPGPARSEQAERPPPPSAPPPISPLRTTPVPSRSPPAAYRPPTTRPEATEEPMLLADRLSAKRGERRSAIHPFGIRPSTGPGQNDVANPDTSNTTPVAATDRPPGSTPGPTTESGLIDDDMDELEGGAPSPGFGTLE